MWVTRGLLGHGGWSGSQGGLALRGAWESVCAASCASGGATMALSSPRLSALTALPVPFALPNERRQDREQKCRLESTLYFGISERII